MAGQPAAAAAPRRWRISCPSQAASATWRNAQLLLPRGSLMSFDSVSEHYGYNCLCLHLIAVLSFCLRLHSVLPPSGRARLPSHRPKLGRNGGMFLPMVWLPAIRTPRASFCGRVARMVTDEPNLSLTCKWQKMKASIAFSRTRARRYSLHRIGPAVSWWEV